MAEDFIKWVDEDSILKIVKNAYSYVEKYIDPNAPDGKEHVGYIVDGNKSYCTKNSTQNTYIIICKYFLNWYNEIRKTNILLL